MISSHPKYNKQYAKLIFFIFPLLLSRFIYFCASVFKYAKLTIIHEGNFAGKVKKILKEI
jgi:hypothetical protein